MGPEVTEEQLTEALLRDIAPAREQARCLGLAGESGQTVLLFQPHLAEVGVDGAVEVVQVAQTGPQASVVELRLLGRILPDGRFVSARSA